MSGPAKPAIMWEASLEFMAADGEVRSTTILYLTETPGQAAADASKWWANRNKAVPDWFATLLAINLHMMHPQRVDADGYLPSMRSMMVAEWKCDFFTKLEDWPAHVTASFRAKRATVQPMSDPAKPDGYTNLQAMTIIAEGHQTALRQLLNVIVAFCDFVPAHRLPEINSLVATTEMYLAATSLSIDFMKENS